jgi:hypothetical protein
MKWGTRLFALAKSDNGYVHNIIASYKKLTGYVCNLPYSEKPFISRIFLSLMDSPWLNVSGIEGYYHFTDRYQTVVNNEMEEN